MAEKALLSQLLVLGSRTSIIGVWIDADATTRSKQSDDLDILGVHQSDEVLHNSIDAVLMEVTMIAEREKIELQALRLDHALVRDIHDFNLGKVGLTRNGTERSKLRTVELYPIIVPCMFILEGLQHLGGVVLRVFHLLA